MKSFLTGFFSAIVLAVIILLLLPDEEKPLQQQTIDLQIPEQQETGPVIVLEPLDTEQTDPGMSPPIEEPLIGIEESGTGETMPAGEESTAAITSDTAETEETDTLGESAEEEAAKPLMVVHQVKSGDTLLSIFNALEIDPQHYKRLIVSKDVSSGLSRLKPGQMLYFYLDGDRNLTKLVHESDSIRSDNYTFTDKLIMLDSVSKQIEKRTETVQGKIQSSLFVDGQNAGMSGKLIMNMARLFNFDIDFGSELQKGDYFGVIYEAEYVDGERIGTGDILAAEFINNNKQYRVVRYEDQNGNVDYLDEEGRSRRKMFIRTPLNFTRISSKFTNKRWHPVLKRWRSHKGVDYAAPTGTPVWATGDGKIHIIGRQSGYGKVIYIKHGKYVTVYGHLNGFKRGLKKGDHVKQGQVIGYVGQTGLATGPHLHYEFRIHGKHVNPLSAKLPVQDPIDRSKMKHFLATAKPLFKSLDLLKGQDVAMND
ncbi:MAG: peptidoglycan DD-metalloendopeptidase family protein [Chromatiales bacterium]|jgi:murein DD-endopeptidase MepM/ murein hydrolase activator NlpD